MKRVHKLWIGVFLGIAVGLLLYFISCSVGRHIESRKSPEIIALKHAISVPTFIYIKLVSIHLTRGLSSPGIVMPISFAVYGGFIGWLFCAAGTWVSKNRPFLIIILLFLMIFIHWYYYAFGIGNAMRTVNRTALHRARENIAFFF